MPSSNRSQPEQRAEMAAPHRPIAPIAAHHGPQTERLLHSHQRQTLARRQQRFPLNQNNTATRKPRVGLYRAWTAPIDEGWTRWILTEYGFSPVTAPQRRHPGWPPDRPLRFPIILPDSSSAQIADGFATRFRAPHVLRRHRRFRCPSPARVSSESRRHPHRFQQRLALRYQTLFSLPVTNILATLNADQFYCSGSLLRIELKSAIAPRRLGPALRTHRYVRTRSRRSTPNPPSSGAILATYPKERNPLASGYLLHPEVIQGKTAALEAYYGKGRIYLLGFRPQWRGQSHGGIQVRLQHDL